MTQLANIKRQIKNTPIIRQLGRKVFEQIPVTYRYRLTEITDTPYSNLERKNKFIFIHIPKTAGNSVISSLYGAAATGHHPLKKYYRHDKTAYYAYFKFGFVRNPWDRAVSAYHYLYQGGKGFYDEEFKNKYIRHCRSFSDFVNTLENEERLRTKIMMWPHFRSQHCFLLDMENKIGVDYLGKFETLEDDFERLCRILKLSSQLKRSNSSNHDDYRSYYTSETMVDTIGQLYSEDCKLFSYDFDKDPT